MDHQPLVNARQSLLLIRERDVGLFSTFEQILNTLYFLEQRSIARVPVALLGRGMVYHTEEGHNGKRSVWEYYFEPLVPDHGESVVLDRLGRNAFDLLESQRKQLELARALVEFPARRHRLPPMTFQDDRNLSELEAALKHMDWRATEHFTPAIDGHEPIGAAVPKARAADLVERYIRPSETVRSKADRFRQRYLDGHYAIGVHIRGTDGWQAPARGVDIPLESMCEAVAARIAELGSRSSRILVASDEAYYVAEIERRFPEHAVSYDCLRKCDGDEIFGRGPTGQVMPGYIQSREVAVQNGEDAVVEYTLLCGCDTMICNRSSLSSAALISVPERLEVPR